MTICCLADPDGRFNGYACMLPFAHLGDHEAHGLGVGNVIKSWPRSFNSQCAAELHRADLAEHAAIQAGETAPEEVAERRRQMRVAR